MEIRKCTAADIPAVGDFYDRVVLWLDAHTNYPKWIYKDYPSESSARVRTEEGCQYICVEDYQIVGAFVLNTDPQGDYEKGQWEKDLPYGSYMVLHTLAIEPDRHGSGIGSAVIDFCIGIAKADGYKALRVDIVPDNLPARKLYEKNGFSYAGDADLGRGIEEIPVFSLFERNW